ncbi:Retrovirus-related Pol polyprotein from transposon TNT 1-94 [Cardamine amara subsp. amara]|uniref:Retrovirus-related Pol polyprotein from transposon TNT 1-94 n=1 Tax=Cardamine amara subsp. amara TaxID=228776 RepID=A0ABD0ZTV9_CARAN
MLFSVTEEEVSSQEDDETWLVDSGCTNHMTKEVKYFITLDKSIKVPIKVGNGQHVMTAGKGNIQVMTSQGEKIIKEVFLVPSLARNLLSVSQMISNGYGVLFEANRCLINDPQGRMVLNIRMKHKSFPFKWRKSEVSALLAAGEEVNKDKLWHRRLGHVGLDKLQKMQDAYPSNLFP